MKRLSIFLVLILCSLTRANIVISFYGTKPLHGTSLQAPVDPNLVGYWLAYSEDTTTAVDLSGNGNNGTLQGDTTYSTGRFDDAWSFDGDGDYIDCGNNPSLQLSTELTISAWVWPNNVEERGYLLSKWSSGDFGYAIYWYGTTDCLRLYYGTGIGNSSKDSSAVFTDIQMWVHCALVKDSAGNVYFYRNGILAGSGTGVTIVSGTENVLIGNRTGGASISHYFNGFVDDFKIYNRALLEGEIADLYNKPFKDFPKKIVMYGGKVIMP